MESVAVVSVDFSQLSRLFTWGRRQNLISETFLKIKNAAVDNVHKFSICINIPLKEIFKS
jgi:hypothetical protein